MKEFSNILDIILKTVLCIFMYKAGKNKVEKDTLKRENKILKEYEKIDKISINRADLYNADKWV